MRFFSLAFTVIACCSGVLAQSSGPKLNLLPWPASITVQQGRLSIGPEFKISVESEQLREPTLRMVRRLENRTGVQLSHDFAETSNSGLVIRSKKRSSQYPKLGEDESYSLTVTNSGAELVANVDVGVLRGLETFLQLVTSDASGYYLPAVTIQDRPRFSWRGLHIDVSRHFEPVEVIKRQLDGMAEVKLNVLHWHLSDDQGFRIESKKYPKLHELGSDGQYYTQQQVKEIINYAAVRGIRVVPEFDIPGHSTAWFVGYPELASGPGPYSIERNFGVFDPTFDPSNKRVYKFLDGFFKEIAKLFPDEYMHIGGDENNGKQWSSNPEIQKFKAKKKLADNNGVQAYFNRKVQKILHKHGKKMVGWDEILHPELPKDIVVQSWRGEASLAAGAKQGYAGILSAPYYLDAMRSAASLYAADPLPANSDLSPEQQKLILGGEACMWAELIGPETIDSRIWPRVGAIAERFWSPREVKDPADMCRRLDRVSVQLEEVGLTHRIQTERMLRRIVQDEEIGPLLTLANTVEPVSLHERSQAEHVTQMTPLVRFIDAVVPDPKQGRDFADAVDSYLANRNASSSVELRREMAEWNSAAKRMQAIIEAHPVLAEVRPRVAELNSLATVGAEAIDIINSRTTASPEWIAAANQVLAEAKKPKGLVRFVIVAPIEKLVLAAGQQNGAPISAPRGE